MESDPRAPLSSRFRQRALNNSGWLTLDRLIRGALNLIVLIFIGRFLGPERFGIFSYALAFVAIFTAFASVAHEGILIRDLVRREHTAGSILGAGFLLRGIGAFSGMLLALLFALWVPDARVEAGLIALLSLGLLLQPFEVIDYWFQSRFEARYAVAIRIAAATGIGLLKVFLAFRQATLPLLAGVTAAESLLGGAGLVWIYRCRPSRPSSWRFTRTELLTLFKESAPMAATSLLVLLFMKLDQMLVARILDFRNLGIYASAVRLLDLCNFLPLALLPSLFPVLVRLKKHHPERLEIILQRLLTGFFLLSLLVVMGCFLGGRFFLQLLFGPEYAAAAPALGFLSFSAVFHYSSFLRAHWMFIEHRVIYHLWGAIIGVAVLGALNLYLIPRWGLVGAAVATSIGYAVSGFGTSFLFPALRPIARLQLRAFLLQWNPPRTESEATS